MQPTATAPQAPHAATGSPFTARIEQLRARMADEGWAGVLLFDLVDVRYLIGLTSSNAALLVTPGSVHLATDFRYVEKAKELHVDGLQVEQLSQGLYQQLGSCLAQWTGGGQVAYDPSALSHRSFLQLTEGLDGGVSLRSVASPVGNLRCVKDHSELTQIRASAKLLEGAYGMVVEAGLVGRTEREVAWSIERYLREHGADGLSFPSIIAGGNNGAFPHHSTSEMAIPANTLVTIDIGCMLNGYASDCTRTFATGELSEKLRTIYDVTLRAQLAALDAIEVGTSGKEIDRVARDIIEEAGYGDYFGHGLGHGVGLEVHEGPRLSRTASDVLEPGMVVTVEPGIYLPDVGGVRIEDLVVVGASSNEILTGFSKDLTVVG
jgi:Xaa-Pro aminopeptidase